MLNVGVTLQKVHFHTLTFCPNCIVLLIKQFKQNNGFFHLISILTAIFG